MLRIPVYAIIENATEGAPTSATGRSHIIIIITIIIITIGRCFIFNEDHNHFKQIYLLLK